jgi:hypothetical protein
MAGFSAPISVAPDFHPMENNLIDPHNHAPEVTPDDEWGDAAGLPSRFDTAATALPAKRHKIEPRSAAPVEKPVAGLRIESRVQLRGNDESAPRLEIQEFSGSVVRLAPEEPVAAKVPRQFTFHERPTPQEDDPVRAGEGREWGRSRKQSVRWIIGTGMAVAALVVVSMMMLPLINKPNAARPNAGRLAMVPEGKDKAMEALNAMLVLQLEAEQVFRKFVCAMIPEDVLPLVRDPGTVGPLIRQNFRPGRVSKAWVPGDDTDWSVFEAGGVHYGILQGTLPDFTHFSAYIALIDGQLLLDWKATTGYGSATFEELVLNQGDPSEIRGMIAPSGYYTAAFPEADFQCYQFVSPTGEHAIWCYARRSEPPSAELSRLFHTGEIIQDGNEPQRVALRLERGPSGSLPNQWLIADFLQKDWLLP